MIIATKRFILVALCINAVSHAIRIADNIIIDVRTKTIDQRSDSRVAFQLVPNIHRYLFVRDSIVFVLCQKFYQFEFF